MKCIMPLPYVYDKLWKEHEIMYYSFYQYELIEDLSIDDQDIICQMFIVKKDNEYYLRGYGDGCMSPYFKEIDIGKMNKPKREQYIKKQYQKIFDKVKKYNIQTIKIYQYHQYSYQLNHDIGRTIGLTSQSTLNMAIDCQQFNKTDLRYNVRNIINRYNDKKIYTDHPIE